jgi:hypothetical protein
MTNSIRPLLVHNTKGAILPVQRARKLSPQINVELVVGLEVFRQHAYNNTLHTHNDVQPLHAGRLTGSPHRPGSAEAGG